MKKRSTDAGGDGRDREGVEGAPHVPARVAVLQPPGEDLVEGRAGDHAEGARRPTTARARRQSEMATPMPPWITAGWVSGWSVAVRCRDVCVHGRLRSASWEPTVRSAGRNASDRDRRRGGLVTRGTSLPACEESPHRWRFGRRRRAGRRQMLDACGAPARVYSVGCRGQVTRHGHPPEDAGMAGWRAVSSVGRAPVLHTGCHRFESCTAHHSNHHIAGS